MAFSHNDKELKPMIDENGNQVFVGPEEATRLRAINNRLGSNQQIPINESRFFSSSASTSVALERKLGARTREDELVIAMAIDQNLAEEELQNQKEKMHNKTSAISSSSSSSSALSRKRKVKEILDTSSESDPKASCTKDVTTPLTVKFDGLSLLFKKSLSEEKEVSVLPLLEAVVHGDFDAVRKIILKNPGLLLLKGEAKDFIGRKITGTAYRMALGAEDAQMAETIKAQLIKVANEEEADAQFKEQFPEGWKEVENEKWSPIFNQLEKLTQAIKKAKQDDITSSGPFNYKITVREGSSVAEELSEFRSLLDATLCETVTTGRHFNCDLLLQAFKTHHYKSNFENYGGYAPERLFWRQVIGYIQRFMPANYSQAFCAGLYSTEEKLRTHLSPDRSLKFHVFDGERSAWLISNFYPISESRLGFDFAITGPYASCGADAVGWNGLDVIQSVLQLKTESIQNLCSNDALRLGRFAP